METWICWICWLQVHKAKEDYENYEENRSSIEGIAAEVLKILDEAQPDILDVKAAENVQHDQKAEATKTETKISYRRTLSGGLQRQKSEVPKREILQRINSKKAAKSYELGHQLTLKWSTGAGPRIGCIADYPAELRLQALEFTNLSPRKQPTPSAYATTTAFLPLSPTPPPLPHSTYVQL